jgi:hypothetical protein
MALKDSSNYITIRLKTAFFSHSIYGFRMNLKINSDYFPGQHYATGLCNGVALCLFLGRN